MIDVAALLGTLINDGLITLSVAEQMNNKGFETGDFTSWTHDNATQSTVTATNAHLGVYKAVIRSETTNVTTSGWVAQTFSTPILDSLMTAFSFYGRSYGSPTSSVHVMITYTDNSTANFTFGPLTAASWTKCDIFAGYTVVIPKYIKSITISASPSSSGTAYVWIDDFTLMAGSSTVSITYDEFDPRCPQLQLLLENYPEIKTWVADSTYRIEHRCRLTLYLKPIRYDETTIANDKDTFFDTKDSIDQILSESKYYLSSQGITNIELTRGGWNDKDSIRVGRGTKNMGTWLQSKGGQDIAIIFRSELVVSCIYYRTDSVVESE